MLKEISLDQTVVKSTPTSIEQLKAAKEKLEEQAKRRTTE